MLKSWQVKHFKAIVEAQTVEPGGVTILTGLNNSGKSSILQSILMIAGTLNNPFFKDQPLLPPSVSPAGGDDDILSDTAADQVLTCDFELMLPLKNDENTQVNHIESCVCRAVKVAVSFRFEQGQHSTGFASDQGGNRIFTTAVPVIHSLAITFPPMNDGDEEVAFRLDAVSEQMNQETPPQVFAANYRLPRKRPLPYHGHFYVNDQQVPGTYQVQEFAHFLPRRLQLSPDAIERQGLHQTPKQAKQPEGKYSTLLTETVKQIEHFFSQQVHYLGPQRTNPLPYQQPARSGKSRSDNVGSKGEYAAALYQKCRTETISWYDPGEQQIKKSSLEDAVNYWVQYLGIASSVSIRDNGHGIFSWQAAQKPGGALHIPSIAGSSISQVLPLLVLGLLAAPGALLLVEQPELFLHQSVQARLADFFVSVAMSGKQCLIETQSENIVTQLRYHIMREGGHDFEKYMLYFADRDDEGLVQFTPIEISPRGAIVNWPEGFFSETLIQEENIRFAYMKKKFEAQAQKVDKSHVVQQGGEQAQDAEHSG